MTTFKINTTTDNQFIDITDLVTANAGDLSSAGAIVVAAQHTTAGIMVNEGFDPDVQRDLLRALAPLAEHDDYRHAEGNSDSHVKAALIGSSQVIPVVNGQLAMGQWQRIFFAEFDGPRFGRTVVVSRLAGNAG